ncbi:MAG: signal recognition particle-docking protein FtsY [Candidatus Ancillula trichonymphae]|jgi:fused signal recognition particle receptor|nr:signal recognition particle-docking protein FtsY [Candidatus Ancillula trichonymphae]
MKVDLLYVVPIIIGVIFAFIFVLIWNKRNSSENDAVSFRSILGLTKPIKVSENLAEVERELYSADFSTELVNEIVVKLDKNNDSNARKVQLKEILTKLLQNRAGTDFSVDNKGASGLQTLLFVGVNGVGKTTTLAKIAHLMASAGKKTLLVGADTFRAAAGEQLTVWANRINKLSNTTADVETASREGEDPASVAFSGALRAVQNGYDYLFVDTAGRLHNNKNLLDELNKIRRSIEKNTPITDVYIVLDGTTGQNALRQAEEFAKVVDITGLVITKLDGSAKGGVVFNVVHKLGVPVKYIGTGEGVHDLQEFDAQRLVDTIVA